MNSLCIIKQVCQSSCSFPFVVDAWQQDGSYGRRMFTLLESVELFWSGSVVSYTTCGTPNLHTSPTLSSHLFESQQFWQVCHKHLCICVHAQMIHDLLSWAYFPRVCIFFGEASLKYPNIYPTFIYLFVFLN